jgi:CRISPR-associated protein Cmr4
MSETTARLPQQQQACLLFLHAQTGMHPGSGTALGTVDLPIQRERHTQWPIVPGSTLKGIIRDCCRPVDQSTDEWQQWLGVFGPESKQAADHAGAVSFTDARILAFPVRSLKGVFAWVTCPAILQRLQRDLDLTNGLAKKSDVDIVELNQLPDFECAVYGDAPKHPLVADDNHIMLEEFEFSVSQTIKCKSGLIEFIEKAVHPLSKDDVARRIVVLGDNWFTHFAQHATEITARIALDYSSKTAKGTALFYQEFLPPETLFYSVVLASPSRRVFSVDEISKSKKNVVMGADDVIGFVRCGLKNRQNYLQIGGDETIGKGLCAVKLDGDAE